jgi:hypothetical protein
MALIPQISKPKKEIARFLQQLPAGSQNIERFFFFFFKLSYLAYSQIWLNFVVGDHQFGYIREMKPKEEENKTKQNNLISIHEAK